VKRAAPAAAIAVGDLILDAVGHRVTVHGTAVALSPTEFRLLATLVAAGGSVVRRRELVAAGWPEGAQVSDNTLDQYLTRLRRKLREAGSALTIGTARGIGHRLNGKSRILRAGASVRPVPDGRRVGSGQAVRGLGRG
jgi:two-component system response regulator MprA